MEDVLADTHYIENIVTPEQADQFEKLIMAGPWGFVDDMSYNKQSHYGFNQTFRHYENGVISPLYEHICVPIINNLLEKTGIQITDIGVARAFLQVPLDPKFRHGTNGVHVDMPIPHYACVYYVRNSDGDTILYDNTRYNTKLGDNKVELVENTRIRPRKGSIVVFDGARYHRSSQPTETHRCIINFDLLRG